MNHTPFIVGAYAAALGGVLGMLVWSWIAMRRAERRADEMRRR